MSKSSSAKLAATNSSTCSLQTLNSNESTSPLNHSDITKCAYCLNSLGNVSIKCNECKNFQLCLKCFSMSAEIGEHKKDHNYYLKSSECFPVFDSENYWTYKEELSLIELIEQFGLGNWEDIAKNLCNRTPQECEKHYYSYYVYGNLGKYTFDSSSKVTTNGDKYEEPVEAFEKPKKSNEIQTTVLLPPIEMSIEEQRALGYMPLRDDFEREFKNDAESLISNLAVANNQIPYLFNENTLSLACIDDDQIDFDLKLTLIKIYRECLIERQRHKKIAREYGLINNASALINTLNKTSNLNNGLGIVSEIHSAIPTVPSVGRPKKHKPPPPSNDKEMTELNDKYKKYAQLMSVSEYESLIDILRKQRQLTERINELNNYRSYGITKLTDIDSYNRQNLEKQKLKLEMRHYKKQTKRMLHYTSPNKRLTRFTNLKSPVKSYSPSKRIKMEVGKLEPQVNDEETRDNNEDTMTDDLDNDNISDDLYQEKSDEEEEEEVEEKMDDAETKDTEEDMSSAGAASSVGSGINEVNTNNIVRRLRRLNSRSSQNNSFSTRAKNSRFMNMSLKSPSRDRLARNLRKKIRRKVSDDEVDDDEDETLNEDDIDNEEEDNEEHDDDEIQLKSKKRKLVVSSRSSSRSSSTASSSLSTSMSNGSSAAESAKTKSRKAKKENLSCKKKSLNNRRSTSERLCSMPGYNLLSENEKKLVLSIHMKPNDYINLKTLIIKNSLTYRIDTRQMSQQQQQPQHPHDAIDLDDSLNECLIKNESNKASTRTRSFFNCLKRSCPTYFEIPRTTRRRILRFLNDNGWIDVS